MKVNLKILTVITGLLFLSVSSFSKGTSEKTDTTQLFEELVTYVYQKDYEKGVREVLGKVSKRLYRKQVRKAKKAIRKELEIVYFLGPAQQGLVVEDMKIIFLEKSGINGAVGEKKYFMIGSDPYDKCTIYVDGELWSSIKDKNYKNQLTDNLLSMAAYLKDKRDKCSTKKN